MLNNNEIIIKKISQKIIQNQTSQANRTWDYICQQNMSRIIGKNESQENCFLRNIEERGLG